MGRRKILLQIIAITIIASSLLQGCQEEENLYFKGDITIIDIFKKELTLIGTKVDLEDIFEGRPFVCDSFIIFHTYRNPEYNFYVFDIKSKQHIASFCPIGEGPDDYLSCDESLQLIKEDGDSKMWVRDFNKQSMHLINITQSIARQKTVCDSVISYEWSNYFQYPLLNVFFLDNGEFLGINQCEDRYSTGGDYTPRDLFLFRNSLGNKVKEYKLYKRPVICQDTRVDFFCSEFYHAVSVIKPDKTRLALAMKMLGQVSIVDIKTGEQKNYRLKESLTYSEIGKDLYKSRKYYGSMAVSNQFIYALYMNVALKETPPPYSGHTIHVFTWDGIPVYKIHVNEAIAEIALDEERHILYATDLEDNLYSYDISNL